MDEKLKHRLIGLAVIVSLFILIIPFLIKKNQPDLTELATLSIEQPTPAPNKPSLAIEPVTIDFAAVQVAQVNLDQKQNQRNGQSTALAAAATLAMSPDDEFMPSEVDPDYLPGEIMPMEPEWTDPNLPDPQPIKPIKPKPLEPAKPAQPQPQLPEPKPEPEPEPVVQTNPIQAASSATTAAQPGDWVVQLGSFANRTNADALFKKLQTKGFPVFVKTRTNAQGTLITRILVGPHPQRGQAEQTLQNLEQAVQLKGIVIQWNG